MEIRDYTKGDELEILDLFKVVFGQELNIKNWYWRFRDNPAGKYCIKLMWDNQKLVGHYAVSPTLMSFEGQDVLTALSLTTMTHPDYQGKGIFSKLANKLFKDLEENYGYKAIWGFPNNNSHYGFIKNLNWKNLSVVHTLSLDVKLLKSKGYKLNIQQIKKFNTSHQTFITKKITNFATNYVKHDLAYLNWRFINKPNSKYKIYELDTSKSKSIIIVKPYLINETKKYILNIISCFMDDYYEIHDTILRITKDLNLEFEKITIWKNLWDPNHLSLEKQGFIPQLPQTYLACRIEKSMSASFIDYRKWYISMSDSDVF